MAFAMLRWVVLSMCLPRIHAFLHEIQDWRPQNLEWGITIMMHDLSDLDQIFPGHRGWVMILRRCGACEDRPTFRHCLFCVDSSAQHFPELFASLEAHVRVLFFGGSMNPNECVLVEKNMFLCLFRSWGHDARRKKLGIGRVPILMKTAVSP